MPKKLLLVHPSKAYDSLENIKTAIVGLRRQFDDDNLFVLHDDGAFKDYLELETDVNSILSKAGEISDNNFLDELLYDCDELTICGHECGACHHTGFEDVVKGHVNSENDYLEIKIPTYAMSSSNYLLDGGLSASEAISDMAERKPPDVKIPSKLRSYSENFTVDELTSKDIATMTLLHQYINTCLYSGVSFDVDIDGRTVFSYERQDNKKKLKLNIQNTI